MSAQSNHPNYNRADEKRRPRLYTGKGEEKEELSINNALE
jgi:hypothetical protein